MAQKRNLEKNLGLNPKSKAEKSISELEIMKRFILALLLCNTLSFSFAQNAKEEIIKVWGEKDNNTLFVEFRLPEFEILDTNFRELHKIDEIFNYIRIDDEFGIIDSVGLPQLPQLSFDLHVPYNAVRFNIETTLETQYEIDVKKKIMPVQEDIDKEKPIFEFQINNAYYNSQGGFCSSPVQLTENFIVFGEQGICITIFPFVYNPVLKKITVLSNATFRISYTLSREVIESYHSEAKENYLSNLFTNYQNNETKNHQKSGGYPIMGRYLMITHPDYESTLIYFANYKRNIGFDVVVVNTNTTGSSASSIKNYIQNQYNNTSTRPDYVLLVGDVDKIPAYEGDASDEPDIDNPITDLGYSLLDGNDNLADVFLGRFSVANETQLKNIINKTIFMEMNMHRFEKKAKFIAGHDDKASMRNAFKKGHEYVIPYSFNPLGYDCQKLYQVSLQEKINALSDNPLFFIYSGHGNVNIFDSVVSSSVQSATNTVFPCLFVFACLTGNFANINYTSVGESFIRAKDKGGIAYFGSSVNTYNNPDEILEKKIFGDAFLKDEQNLAVIINLGKRRFSYTSVTNKRKKRYIKAYNLLGDPSFDTKGIGCKQSFTFNNPEVFKSGAEITYRANDFIQNSNDFIIESGANVKLLAGNSVILKPGFKAEYGSNVKIEIVPCNDGVIRKFMTENDEITDDAEKGIQQETEELINPALFSIFPNPTTDDFSLVYTLDSNSFVKIDLYSLSGSLIKNFLQLSQQESGIYYYNFLLSGLTSGMYVIVFKSNAKTISNKIVKY
jgi:hypothetical protein